jgi:hypothetical protein
MCFTIFNERIKWLNVMSIVDIPGKNYKRQEKKPLYRVSVNSNGAGIFEERVLLIDPVII